MLRIHSIETFGTQDWPGIRFIAFVQWCNFRCLYCQNPDTWKFGWWKEFSDEELIEKIEREEVYFGDTGWVTIGGGEPLTQAKSLISFFKKLKKMGIHTALDTNASILNDDVKELLKYTDLVIADIKHMNNTWHKKITGCPNNSVFDFVEYMESIWQQFWVRQVFVPWYSDQKENIENLWKYLSKFKNLQRTELLAYHLLGRNKWDELWIKYNLDDVPLPQKEKLLEAKKILDKYIKNTYIRM
jgi:pyruvate formate lyase activating enzyme